ncbi:MAG: hypothetical protein ABF443_06970 [Acetobacter malorum]|uniref:hypothetical protein n=1 Tax=Acetobacter malorum TaxID=178901 RepID=UPI0039EA4628
MNRQDAEKQLLEGIDTLAAVEHQRWAHWQRYMHNQGIKLEDGALLLPADLVKRWERQMDTPFEELSEDEKDSDRDQVRQYISVIACLLSN